MYTICSPKWVTMQIERTNRSLNASSGMNTNAGKNEGSGKLSNNNLETRVRNLLAYMSLRAFSQSYDNARSFPCRITLTPADYLSSLKRKDMSEIKTMEISVSNVPTSALEYLVDYAKSEGHSTTNSGVVRFAIVKLATTLGWKPDNNEASEKNDAA